MKQTNKKQTKVNAIVKELGKKAYAILTEDYEKELNEKSFESFPVRILGLQEAMGLYGVCSDRINVEFGGDDDRTPTFWMPNADGINIIRGSFMVRLPDGEYLTPAEQTKLIKHLNAVCA